jgi:nitric oxide dioxygenase
MVVSVCLLPELKIMGQNFISLIQDSFANVFRHKGELAERFYHHLFTALPEARGMFRNDFFHQKEMFVMMLASTVRSLSSEESFEALGDRLARQHASFGVSSDQYQAATDALVSAMKDVLGEDLSQEEEQAWKMAISRLTRKMARDPAGQVGSGV